MLNKLPKEMLINIFTSLNIFNGEIFNTRLVNKKCQKILDTRITICGYPDLQENSFFLISMEYHVFLSEKIKLNRILNDKFEIEYINKLIDNGWL